MLVVFRACSGRFSGVCGVSGVSKWCSEKSERVFVVLTGFAAQMEVLRDNPAALPSALRVGERRLCEAIMEMDFFAELAYAGAPRVSDNT